MEFCIMKVRNEYTCPLEVAHDIIKGKWKPVILYQINHLGRASLSRLEKDINGISQKGYALYSTDHKM